MPPLVMTKVMPTVTTPMTDAWVRTSWRLLVSRNSSGLVMPPTDDQDGEDAEQREVADVGAQAERAHANALLRPARGLGGGSRRRVLLRRRGWLRHAVGLPSITRSSTRCSSSSRASRRVHDAALAEHQHPVGEAQHFGHFAGDEQYGEAFVGQPADHGVELGAGADVDAAGGLVEQQDPAAAQQPAGEHGLLLVAAGEGADAGVGVVGAQGEFPGRRPCRRAVRRPGRASRRGRSGTGRRRRRCG